MGSLKKCGINHLAPPRRFQMGDAVYAQGWPLLQPLPLTAPEAADSSWGEV